MAALEWSPALELGVARMDDTHREFVALLAEVEAADDAALLPAWQALIAHTQQHFDQEDFWMAATHFAAGNCHSTQHAAVLNVMREGAKQGAAGNLALVRSMAAELVHWFPIHADSMDAALAQHLQQVGYDPASGQLARPEALPGELIHGCSGACAGDDLATPAAVA